MRHRTRQRVMWWSLVFSAVTTTGLLLLVCLLIATYAIAYVITDLSGHEDALRTDGNGFGVAFALAVLVNMGTALTLASLAGQSPIRTWPPVLQGLAVALLALAASVCAISVPLGLSPLELVRFVLQV